MDVGWVWEGWMEGKEYLCEVGEESGELDGMELAGCGKALEVGRWSGVHERMMIMMGHDLKAGEELHVRFVEVLEEVDNWVDIERVSLAKTCALRDERCFGCCYTTA